MAHWRPLGPQPWNAGGGGGSGPVAAAGPGGGGGELDPVDPQLPVLRPAV